MYDIYVYVQRRFSKNSKNDASRKATELRQCLLNLGFIIFWNFLNAEV